MVSPSHCPSFDPLTCWQWYYKVIGPRLSAHHFWPPVELPLRQHRSQGRVDGHVSSLPCLRATLVIRSRYYYSSQRFMIWLVVAPSEPCDFTVTAPADNLKRIHNLPVSWYPRVCDQHLKFATSVNNRRAPLWVLVYVLPEMSCEHGETICEYE